MLLVTLVSMVVIFLLLYLVGGFLYNRFVLQLKGFDQIPQFSLTSLKYHATSVWEIICDTYQILRQSALGAATPHTDRTANMSVSHHFRHTASTPSTADPETTVGANGLDSNGIIRL
jgi:cation-dependent mannose-6-phosphate receptor